MMGLYEDGAVFVTNSGRPIADPAAIASELEAFMSVGLPMTAHARYLYVANDVAMFILDWESEGTSPDGRYVHLKGSATDVAHRGEDGLWRYAIDNPYGTRFRQV